MTWTKKLEAAGSAGSEELAMPQETELLYLVLLIMLTLIIDLILRWTTPKPKASALAH